MLTGNRLVAGAGVLLLAALASHCAQAPASPPAPALWGDMKALVSVKELMADMIDPISDNIFDAVTCSLMAHHLPTGVKVKMLREIFRVLKPGGRMAFFDISRPTRLDEWWRVLAVLSLDLLFEWHCGAANLRGELLGMIQNAGFEIADERLRHLRGVRAQFVLGRKP